MPEIFSGLIEEKTYKVKIWWSDGEYSEEFITSVDEPRKIVNEWFEAYPDIYQIYLYTPDGTRMIGKGHYKRKKDWRILTTNNQQPK